LCHQFRDSTEFVSPIAIAGFSNTVGSWKRSRWKCIGELGCKLLLMRHADRTRLSRQVIDQRRERPARKLEVGESGRRVREEDQRFPDEQLKLVSNV
jgi:hypothetical protein